MYKWAMGGVRSNSYFEIFLLNCQCQSFAAFCKFGNQHLDFMITVFFVPSNLNCSHKVGIVVVGSIPDGVTGFFLIYLILPAALWLGGRLSL
jgi:hypothetical protein